MIAIKTHKEINYHFHDFIDDWNSKFYFLVGGYGSSKSYHVALKLVLKLLKEKRKALVVREVFDTHRDSTFSLLCEIISSLNLEAYAVAIVSPMQIRFKNGSKIIFKGMDRPEKLKSINDVTIVWLEECSEIKYAGFKEILGRLRHPTLSLHFILSTNPVEKNNWTYKRFFIDEENNLITLDDEQLYRERTIVLGNTYYHHSTVDDNKFVQQDYIDQLNELKHYDPDLYRIARYGRFGVNGVKVLPQFETAPHEAVLQAVGKCKLKRVGMDFGFEESFNAIVRVAVNETEKILYIYYEYYKNKMTDDKTAVEIGEFKDSGEVIHADCAEPKTIRYYNQQGFRMTPCTKFAGSRLANIKKVKRFKKIICSEECKNVIRELSSLTYAKDRNGNLIDDEFNIDPHTFSAVWYALDGYEVADLKERFNYSGKGARA